MSGSIFLIILIVIAGIGYLIGENTTKNIRLGVIILLSFCAGIAFTDLIQNGLKEESFLGTIITPLTTLITAFFVGFQAFATRELVRKTLMPVVVVGLKSEKENETEITKVFIHNVSNFPVWIWLSIRFYRKNKNDNDKNKEILCEEKYGENYAPIPPNYVYMFAVEKIKSYIDSRNDDEVIYALIEYRCAIDHTPPGPEVKPIVIKYGYGPEKEWLESGWGKSSYLPPIISYKNRG